MSRLEALDEATYQRLTSGGSPVVDTAARLLTRAANRSTLWLTTSVVLAVSGGTRGRRAALRGVVSIGFASLVANTVLKSVWRRTRPAEDRPTLVRRPESFSFPSGHTASAFAFATAVGVEIPALAAPLGLAAAAVGYSRIRGRVHYPSDVVAGALVGVAAAFLTRPISTRIAR